MIELKSITYESLLPLLTDIPINTWFARSVLVGHADGKVFVDKEQDPASVYICNGYGMTLLLGKSDNEIFNDELSHHLCTLDKCEWIQAYPRSWDVFLQSLVNNGTANLSVRVNLNFNRDIFEKNNNAPDTSGIDVISGTSDLIKNIDGSVVPKHFWKESSISMCKSYVALINNEPAAVAFSSYLHDEYLEIGIETVERYRGMGLATKVCTALIRYCINEGLTPVWSCRLDNIGSMNLAKRVGFIENLRLPYYIVNPRVQA